MRRGSLRERVRAAGRELEQGEGFLYVALEDFLGVKSEKDQKRLQIAVQDLVKAGELQRPARGRLRYVPPPPPALPSKQQIMWKFLRLSRQATKEQLRAVAAASERTVKDFCAAAVRQRLAEILPDGSLRLLNDAGPECPFDTVRADRAKAWREKQRQALVALDDIFLDAIALAQKAATVRLAVSQMEEG